MKIVKFCSQKYNPLVSETTIQLGTLYYYKSTDNDFIRDVEEGEMPRSYHPSEPVVYTGDEIRQMTGGSISGTGTSFRFEGRAVRTTNPIPNAYLFCTSHVDEPTKEHAASLRYDSFYVIKDPKVFCDRIRQEVRRVLTGSSDVLAFHRAVSYQENKEVIFSQLLHFFRSHQVIDPYLYFLKPRTSRENPHKVYANEHEYRFVFVPINERKEPIRLTSEKIYLESSAIKDVLEQV